MNELDIPFVALCGGLCVEGFRIVGGEAVDMIADLWIAAVSGCRDKNNAGLLTAGQSEEARRLNHCWASCRGAPLICTLSW
jgi:hypothetical protein